MRIAYRTSAYFCVFGGLLAGCANLRAQAPAASSGFTECLSVKGTHPCDWLAFRTRFAAAHSVWVKEAPLQQSSYTAMVKMLQAKGKVMENSPTGKADLMVMALQSPSKGISIGPADQRLGQLLVFSYDWSTGNGRSELIWIENFSGQPDRPWPSVVAALVNQFQDRLKKNNR